jgi:uncharacterized protein (DUF2141 family)
MILFTKHLLILLLSTMTPSQEQTESYSITVNIENLKSDDGQVLVGLYDSEADWLSTTYMGEVANISNNSCSVVFKNVPQGIYAVSYIHDANNNGEMDANFMGIPKEDFGCSNNAKGFMGPPKWEDAKFELTKSIEIVIK